jgi:polysaccharide export outer membrane protein
MQGYKHLGIMLLTALCSGCVSFPVAGPLSRDVVGDAGSTRQSEVGYVLIDVTPSVCETLSVQPSPPFHSVFGNEPPKPDYAIGVGDTLSITIWEAGNTGLFSGMASLNGTPAPRGATLPPLIVAQDGRITMPYAGRIAVAGKTSVQAERAIVAGLASKADNPQVVVAVAHSQTNVAIVGGEVANAARVPLGVDGVRVLDAVADAGGVRIPVNESQVRLTRGVETASVPYAGLLRHPEDNVFLRPGDIVTVTREPNTFSTFGALGRNSQIPFETETLSVDEALAKSGGFLDHRADPAGVFIFRYEPADLVRKLVSGRNIDTTAARVPVVYRLDMSHTGSYFLARQFAVRDKDIVYAANAPMNEVQKFLNMLGSVLTPAATGAAVSAAVVK